MGNLMDECPAIGEEDVSCPACGTRSAAEVRGWLDGTAFSGSRCPGCGAVLPVCGDAGADLPDESDG